MNKGTDVCVATLKTNELEIWPKRPRYFAATIAVHRWWGGGQSQGVTSQKRDDTSVGGEKVRGGGVTCQCGGDKVFNCKSHEIAMQPTSAQFAHMHVPLVESNRNLCDKL